MNEKNKAQLSALTGEQSERTENNFTTISSREVAEMMEVNEHSKMLKKIDTISETLTKAKFGLSDYWYESTYKDSTGRTLREYQVTKKGCELIAHKTEGEKGIIFTVKYMERFEQLEQYVKDSYMITDPVERAKRWIEEQQEKKLLETEVKVKDQIIGEMKPKTTYYDLVLQSNSLMPISLIAKDYGMGAQTLNKLLHDLGVQYNQSGTWLLYSKYQGKGYTQSKTTTYQKKDGTPGTNLHTQWTQQGRLFIYDLLKQNGIVPTIEKEDKL